MKVNTITLNGQSVAIIDSGQPVITDTATALDLILSVTHEKQTDRVAIRKEAITEEFFILSSGLAGEILQKFVNYGIKAAIYGDYSRYTSRPLRDFIYESNQGKTVAFVSTQDDAVEKLVSMSS